MKSFILIIFLNFALFAAHIDDFAKAMEFERDYSTALTKAKKEDKILMFVLSADYCPWCRKFENKTLRSKVLKPILDQDVISLVVDKKYDASSFPKKFITHFTPKVFFINPHTGDILGETTGYVKKKDFASSLSNIVELYRVKP